MQRVTVTLEDEQLEALDSIVSGKGYQSRSEALRDILRDAIIGPRSAHARGPCLAALSYVYDHETRELSRRLTHVQHAHHDLTVASVHVHLDPSSCLEVAILKGEASSVEEFAASVTTQRGVRYGNLHLIPATAGESKPHRHPPRAKRGPVFR